MNPTQGKAAIVFIRTKPYPYNERMWNIFDAGSYLTTLWKDSYMVVELSPGIHYLWGFTDDGMVPGVVTVFRRVDLNPSDVRYLVLDGKTNPVWRELDQERAEVILRGLTKSKTRESWRRAFQGKHGKRFYGAQCKSHTAAHMLGWGLEMLGQARELTALRQAEKALSSAGIAVESLNRAKDVYHEMSLAAQEEMSPKRPRFQLALSTLARGFQGLLAVTDQRDVVLASERCMFAVRPGYRWYVVVEEKCPLSGCRGAPRGGYTYVETAGPPDEEDPGTGVVQFPSRTTYGFPTPGLFEAFDSDVKRFVEEPLSQAVALKSCLESAGPERTDGCLGR